MLVNVHNRTDYTATPSLIHLIKQDTYIVNIHFLACSLGGFGLSDNSCTSCCKPAVSHDEEHRTFSPLSSHCCAGHGNDRDKPMAWDIFSSQAKTFHCIPTKHATTFPQVRLLVSPQQPPTVNCNIRVQQARTVEDWAVEITMEYSNTCKSCYLGRARALLILTGKSLSGDQELLVRSLSFQFAPVHTETEAHLLLLTGFHSSSSSHLRACSWSHKNLENSLP